MSWATENKFLTGYIIIMALGAGALGYQVFSASGAYDAATEAYNSKAQSYNSLRKQVPTPNRDNLAKLEAQKKEAADVINAFQADLARREFPLTPTTPADFQETLRKTVNTVKTKADAAGVRLGKDREKDAKFYLGFQRYETSTPDQGVSTLLGRDLKAIEWVVDQLIETPVISINDIKRPELPQESRRPATPAPRTAPGARPGATPPSNLVTTHSFDVSITCRQQQLAKVLNVLVNPNAPQFLIPRNVKVANSMPKPPSKIDPAAALAASNAAPVGTPDPSAPAGQATPAPAATPAASSTTIKYLLGEETIDATITLDIVDFAEPGAAEPAAATPAPRR